MTTAATPQIDDLYRTLTADRPNEAVSVILKLRGDTCDIDCLYCYEKRKLAPSGRRLDAIDAGRICEVFGDRPVVVELHGGEPLTAGHDHVGAVLDTLATQPNVIAVSLQTNGVQLDRAWLDLFDAHYPDLRIGISLDGDAYGNSWRVGYDGRSTYERTIAALELLAERDRTAGVITVVTPAVLGRAEDVLEHLCRFPAISSISFVPCFDVHVDAPTAWPGTRPPASREYQRRALSGAQRPAWATSPAQYADFVLAATAHWISTAAFRRVALEPAVSVIRRLRGLHTTNCHFTGLKCNHVLTLYPDDRLGSCDELPWPGAQLTTARPDADEGTVAAAQHRSPLLNRGRALMSKCAGCSYAATCGGGCVATRLRYVHIGNDDPYCDHRQRLIDGTAALLAAPQHSAGAFCRQIRWRARHPNSMADAAGFLARWDDASVERRPAQLRTSPTANINTIGKSGVWEADDLDPHHPQWRDGIEDTAWPLVDLLTREWRCVTYDSCAGHPTDVAAPPTALRVGVLPRDRGENARIADRLCSAVTAAGPLLPVACTAAVTRAVLTSERGTRTYPVLDLHIEPANDTRWAQYFAALPVAVGVLVTALSRTPPGAPCACHTTPHLRSTQ